MEKKVGKRVLKAKKTAAPTPKSTPAAKAAPKGNNMALGKLKGAYQERKSRLDAAIDEQTGYKKRK